MAGQVCSVAGIDALYVVLVSLDRPFSNRKCALSAASLLSPKGLVPAEWTGRLRVMALTTVNRLVRALSLSWRRLDFTSVHGLVSCQGYQRLEVGSGGFLSLASGFDASGILSQG